MSVIECEVTRTAFEVTFPGGFDDPQVTTLSDA